jgi:UDP-3-O-[3-hydroxymyristoyl] glucosamine N-acyltransferase
MMAAHGPKNSFVLSEIAAGLHARLEGDGNLRIRGTAEPAMAGPEDLALAMQPKFAEGLPEGRAQAAILWEGADWHALGLKAALFVPRPRYAMAGLTALLDPGPDIAPGIHPSAVIDPSAEIGPGAAIGPLAVIGPGARIGRNARIGPHASVGRGAVLGDDLLLNAGARIAHNVQIGDRFIGQPNSVVGGDGLSFVTPEKSGVERARETLGDQGEVTRQSWTRIHSLGGVVVGDDVELGASSCIDAGTIRPTRVGNGVKIDNLCHVAHNVEMGDDCLMAALVGIAGSTTIGNRCVFGGQAGVADNLFIGDDAIVTAATAVLSNVPAGRVMMGYPAVRMDQQTEMYKALRRLPRFMARFSGSEKAVSKRGQSD